MLCISSSACECEGVMSDSLLFGVWISVDVYEVIFGGQLGFCRPPSCLITFRRHLARAFWNQTLWKIFSEHVGGKKTFENSPAELF